MRNRKERREDGRKPCKKKNTTHTHTKFEDHEEKNGMMERKKNLHKESNK